MILQKSSCTKFTRFLRTIFLLCTSCLCVYFFVASIDFLSDSFRLLGGKEIANIFKSNEILKNPIADVMIGLLFTTILHSSTVTTISVVMVNAQALTVQQGVYVAMGANVGTAITTMIVALFESGQNQEFGRAFSAATIHCVYNWMGLLTFFPIEWIMQLSTGKGFLNWSSQWLVNNVAQLNSSSRFQYDLVGKIVDPFTTRIMQVDNDVISELLQGKNVSKTIRKEFCSYKNGTTYKCSFLLNVDLSDKTLGGILLVAALIILVCCMIGNIKVLSALLGGHVQATVKRLLNFQLPGQLSFLTSYICIVFGATVAFIIQSSSIFVATLVPLVAMDVIELERFWVFEVGADVGTACVSVLAAFSTDTFVAPLQLALCHFLFNFLSIPLFYSLPKIRRIPLALSAYIGRTTSEYKWFAVVFMLFVFLFGPLTLLALSIAGTEYVVSFVVLFIISVTLWIFLKTMHERRPDFLPEFTQNWNFLPKFMRSLRFWDEFFGKLATRSRKTNGNSRGDNDKKKSNEESRV